MRHTRSLTHTERVWVEAGTCASIYLAIRLPICMLIPCDLSIYVNTQVVRRVRLDEAQPPPSFTAMLSNMVMPSLSSLSPTSSLSPPAGGSLPAQAAGGAQSQPLQPEVS